MNILVIDQCSKAKTAPDESRSVDADAIDEHGLETLRERPGTASKPARKLYAGRQQKYIDSAVDKLRASGDTVTRYFISAGFGLVAEAEELPLYDVSFTDLSDAEIERRAAALDIQAELKEVVAGDYDLIFFALGSDYYTSFDVEAVLAAVPEDTWAVCFNQASAVESVANALSIPAKTAQAKEHGTIVVALKGQYLQNFASHRANGQEVTDASDIKRFCQTAYTTQTNLDQLD